MAYFAKIDSNGKVISVHSVANEIIKDSNGIEQEYIGIGFLNDLHGQATWKQTSYNTHGGIHYSNGIPFRKNYAGTGYFYDQQRDAFIPPKPYNSWVLNETTCLWESPVPYPTDNKIYKWNEQTQNWNLLII